MKKRLISVLLVLAMLSSMLPMMAVETGAVKRADQMTEAEAWQAGFEVYTAWYNLYNRKQTIEAFFDQSNFITLYEARKGQYTDWNDHILDARIWSEDLFNTTSEAKEDEASIIMSELLSITTGADTRTGVLYDADSVGEQTLEELMNIEGDDTTNEYLRNLLATSGKNFEVTVRNTTAKLLEENDDISILAELGSDLLSTIDAYKTAMVYETLVSPDEDIADLMEELWNQASLPALKSLAGALSDSYRAVNKKATFSEYFESHPSAVYKNVVEDLFEESVNRFDKYIVADCKMKLHYRFR